MRTVFVSLAIATMIVVATLPARAAELLMFEEEHCMWCARWNEEIGGIFSRTEEGSRAPLRRLDLHAERPEDIVLASDINFTPTFVLVADGAEVGRIEGYPGAHFFWPMLGRLLARLEEDRSPATPALPAQGARE